MFQIQLVEFDYNIQHVGRYKHGDWKKIKMHGRGGTSFQNLIAEINKGEKGSSPGRLVIIFTDGEADWPEKQPYPIVLIIVSENLKDARQPPDWATKTAVGPKRSSRFLARSKRMKTFGNPCWPSKAAAGK